jgi:hypothetical protein
MNASPVVEGIKAYVVNDFLKADLLDSRIKAEISDVIIIEIGGGEGEEVVTVIPFTVSDLVNGELVRMHGLGRRVVSVTVTNQQGLEFEPSINNLNDNTRVLIDLSRYNITGTWYLTIR